MTDSETNAAKYPIRIYLAASAVVLLWKTVALFGPPPESDLTLQTLLAGLGVVYLLCGGFVLLKSTSPSASLFAVYCICSGLHWGGPLYPSDDFVNKAFLMFYVLTSSILAQAFFLHFALRYLSFSWERRATVRAVLYAPTAISVILITVAFLPVDESSSTLFENLFLLVQYIVSNGFAVTALILFVLRIFRPREMSRATLSLLVFALLSGWLPYIVTPALGLDAQPFTLTFAVIPIAFCIALTRLNPQATRPAETI